MGCPNKEEWPDGHKLGASLGIQLEKDIGQNLEELIPKASPEAISLINSLLQINPQKRPTALQAIKHEYFQVKAPL